MAFQDIPRLKTMKCINEKNYTAIFGNSDSIVFLGSQDTETLKYFSEALGKETIEYRTRSRQGFSTQKTGRELATPSELRRMPRNKCIVLFTGKYACFDDKYPFLKHPNIKLTAIPRDGSGLPDYSVKNIKQSVLIEPSLIKDEEEANNEPIENNDTESKRELFIVNWFKKLLKKVKK